MTQRFQIYDRARHRHIIAHAPDPIAALALALARSDWTPGRAARTDPASFIDLRSHPDPIAPKAQSLAKMLSPIFQK